MLNLKTEELALIISICAIFITIISFWYNSLRVGAPIFTCSRWTAIGLDNSGQQGSSFVIKIGVINYGNRPLIIKDFLLIAETHNKKEIVYDPIILFDLTYYIASIGKQNRIADSQKGQIPLPIIIPPNKSYNFEYEMLFMPFDKKTTIINNQDAPFILKLYARLKNKSYNLIAEQNITKEDIVTLTNGSFRGVLSTSSIEHRQKFLDEINKKTA